MSGQKEKKIMSEMAKYLAGSGEVAYKALVAYLAENAPEELNQVGEKLHRMQNQGIVKLVYNPADRDTIVTMKGGK